MTRRLRARLWAALKDICKSESTLKLLGCTIEELKTHIENQFQPGMTWENWSYYGWHIDHIRPCTSFNLTDPIQQKQCFHYSNLQPLWSEENLLKNSYWEGKMIRRNGF